MSKYDEFDLDLTNIKIGDSTAGFTDTPTDRTCPEDSCATCVTCNCPTDDYKCDERPTRVYTNCICQAKINIR